MYYRAIIYRIAHCIRLLFATLECDAFVVPVILIDRPFALRYAFALYLLESTKPSEAQRKQMDAYINFFKENNY